MHSERYVCPCPRQKSVEFSAWSGDLVDVQDVFLRSSEFSVRVLGLVSFYCIIMQAIWCLKFLTWQNLVRQFALASPTPNSEDSYSCPMIYAHESQSRSRTWHSTKQGVALTGRNRTGPLCSVGRRTSHTPGTAAADHPRALQTTTDGRRRRQTTACKTIPAH